MIAPSITPELAERSLIGAAIHAFSVRAHVRSTPTDHNDLEFARTVAGPAEQAESATAYAISLVWWAHRDLPSRRALLAAATELTLSRVHDSGNDRPYEAGYQIYADRLTHVALEPKIHAAELDLAPLVSGVDEIDRLTARFAETVVHSVLLCDRSSFGDPAVSSETMRDEMIHLAYGQKAA